MRDSIPAMSHITTLILALTLAAAGCAQPCPFDDDPALDLSETLCSWEDHADNPLVEPPTGQFLIGDPTVVPPARAPDGRWHMFANSLFGVHHLTSSDGTKWTRTGAALFGAMAFRAFVIKEGATFYLFFEKIVAGESSIKVSTSDDLYIWSVGVEVLKPDLPWEKEGTATVSNPYVFKKDGDFWLYHSAGGVWLADAGVFEPKYIGLAQAKKITGPYVKEGKPLISPDKADPLRNLGAGSIKLMDHKMGGRYVALSNGIYADAKGKTRSAIMVLQSEDARAWKKVCPGSGAVISPTDSGWKAALVYGFDTEVVGDELRAYYNARDGWAPAVERIGLSTCDLGCEAP